MREHSESIDCADGFSLRGTLFDAADRDAGSGARTVGDRASRGAIVIASAMGVPRRFYQAFARYLAGRGFPTLTFDYRGIGDSTEGPTRGAKIRMEDWGRLDIDEALRWMKQRHPGRKLFLIGHSAGGQLLGLAPASAGLDAIVFTAVSSAWWGHWRGGSRIQMLATMFAIVPALGLGRDFFPPKKGGLSTIPIPTGVTSQWARWARSRGYLYDRRHGLDLANYARLTQPLLALQFDDDDYAPQSAHDAVLAAFPNAQITRRPVRASDHGGKVGHFGFFRDQHRDTLWRETADWLQATGQSHD